MIFIIIVYFDTSTAAYRVATIVIDAPSATIFALPNFSQSPYSLNGGQ